MNSDVEHELISGEDSDVESEVASSDDENKTSISSNVESDPEFSDAECVNMDPDLLVSFWDDTEPQDIEDDAESGFSENDGKANGADENPFCPFPNCETAKFAILMSSNIASWRGW